MAYASKYGFSSPEYVSTNRIPFVDGFMDILTLGGWSTSREEQAALKNDQALADYNARIQDLIFQREDNAVQRRVADLEAAGLSPMLAAGQSAGVGQAISVNSASAPQRYNGLDRALSMITAGNNIAQTVGQIKLNKLQRDQAEYNLQYAKDNNLPVGQGRGGFSISLPGGFSFSGTNQEFENLIGKIKDSVIGKWFMPEEPNIPSWDDYKDSPAFNYVAEYVGY